MHVLHYFLTKRTKTAITWCATVWRMSPGWQGAWFGRWCWGRREIWERTAPVRRRWSSIEGVGERSFAADAAEWDGFAKAGAALGSNLSREHAAVRCRWCRAARHGRMVRRTWCSFWSGFIAWT